MKLNTIFILTLCLLCAPLASAQTPFNGFTNQGLVGVGRIPANSFDQLGTNVDTLGGVFSAMEFDRATLQRTGGTYSGTLYGLPDRGFGDGAQDFHPRLQRFAFSLTPYYGTTPVQQNQISLVNNNTLLFKYDGNILFTGFDANDAISTQFPRSAAGSLGQGRRSLDPEGVVLKSNGGYWVSDEYGPFIYGFNSAGVLETTLTIPAALLPRTGAAFPRTINFTGTSAPTVGRNNNRGLEGLTASPDGKRLVAMLQSPTIQDSVGGSANNSLNTRILVYDTDPLSFTNGQLIGEYVYTLTNQGSAAGRSTPISEIYALNHYQFLILERDNIGLGGTDGAPRYKKVNLADVSAATNILGTGYDLEPGAPGALSLPATTLSGTGITPAARLDFVNLLDAAQLAKFGLNANATRDQNSLAEKWEGLSLVPALDANAPNDYLLLVGNDNDFKAASVYHNGVVVGTNNPTVDSMVLAYRVTLPFSRQTAVRKRDFDGDGKSDLTVYRDGNWYTLNSSNQSFTSASFGVASDVPIAEDFNGDDRADYAVYRGGNWYILDSATLTFRAFSFGLPDDIPLPGDYDGDGRADITVFRPSNGEWYFLNSYNNRFRSLAFGQNGDVPVRGDYDGDGILDVAVYRPSNFTWYLLQSRAGYRPVFYGQTGDVPQSGDFDGDGKTDLIHFRNGTWSILQGSNNSSTVFVFGQANDIPVMGDYDGDGRSDIAVFRAGNWYSVTSASNSFQAVQWGAATDTPIR